MRKVNSKLVGAFVLGAIALFMAAVIVFGKGHFFRPTLPVVMYFTGSVKGLQAGSAITFRGVTVGQVTIATEVSAVLVRVIAVSRSDRR